MPFITRSSWRRWRALCTSKTRCIRNVTMPRLVSAKRCATCASAGGAPGGMLATGTLHSKDDAVCYERAVAVIADDRNALAGARRRAGREDLRAVLKIDQLHVTVTAHDREAIRMEIRYTAQDHVMAIV